MKHIIVGTAGHVDHGKTQLVRALTGVDTDRLAEEKRRGLTIETGFARLDFPDGSYAGVVDVPGHEKFIKNMLAGAGGIDLAMLVIAADEGFMPQTAEHLSILSLLGVHSGAVVLTKCDLADAAQLARVRAQVSERVRGTFLESAPVAEVSSVTGQGIGALRTLLHTLVQQTQEKDFRVPFRLPIDRVFSVDGFGTVVTGTLVEGVLHPADAAELLPGGAAVHVRHLQVHGKAVEAAYAGQRVAVNLAGLGKADVARGDVLVKPASVRLTRMLDVRLSCLSDSARTVLDGSRLHFYCGTSVRLAKAALLDRSVLKAGESCYAQLRFTEDVALKRGDRFVVRFYSPLETIGGGIVLDDAPVRHKRNDGAVLVSLAALETGSMDARVLQALDSFGTALPSAAQLSARSGMEEAQLRPLLAALCAGGDICEPLTGRYLSKKACAALTARCEALLADYHRENPLHAGMPLSALSQSLFHTAEREQRKALLSLLSADGRFRSDGERVSLADFTVRYTKRQCALREELLRLYRGMGLRPVSTQRVLARLGTGERREATRVLESLLAEGLLLPLAPERCLHEAVYLEACRVIRTHFAAHETLTLAAARDALGCSRDDALLLLEYLDRRHVTKREGDVRRLDCGFSA